MQQIAFFLPSFEIGGAERNTLKLLSFLDRQKYQLSLVLGQKIGGFVDEIPKDVAVVDLYAKGYLATFFAIKRYLATQKPDVLVSAFPHFNVICLAARQFSGAKTKIIITEHTPYSLLTKTARNLRNKMVAMLLLPLAIKIYYPKANAIICVSRGVKEDLEKLIAVKNATVIYNPIVDSHIESLAAEPVQEVELFADGLPVIIAVGRLAKAKDYPTLFAALAVVLQKRPAKLLILGQGPEEAFLKTMARKMGLQDKIHFLGFQKNPYAYLKKSHVYVLSSVQEGFGNSIVEAMACGVPVVATNCHSGPAEIIEDGKNGLLVPVQNSAALAEAILSVLENPALAGQLSQEGKNRAANFSTQASVHQYQEVFDHLNVWK